MIRSLYDWVIRLAGHRRAIPALGVISFLESSLFPIPPDVMLVPMVLANKAKAFRIALVCTVCSVLGGLLGYAIGYYFFETIGEWVVKTYGLQSGLAAFRAGFEEYGIWIILIKGLTPIPYKLVTIASGVAGFASSGWAGFVAPKGTPQAVIDKLREAILQVSQEPEIVTALQHAGADPWTTTPEERTRLWTARHNAYFAAIDAQ